MAVDRALSHSRPALRVIVFCVVRLCGRVRNIVLQRPEVGQDLCDSSGAAFVHCKREPTTGRASVSAHTPWHVRVFFGAWHLEMLSRLAHTSVSKDAPRECRRGGVKEMGIRLPPRPTSVHDPHHGALNVRTGDGESRGGHLRCRWVSKSCKAAAVGSRSEARRGRRCSATNTCRGFVRTKKGVCGVGVVFALGRKASKA